MFVTQSKASNEKTPPSPPPSLSSRTQRAQLDATSIVSHEVDEHTVLLSAFSEADLVQTEENAQVTDDEEHSQTPSIANVTPSTTTIPTTEEADEDSGEDDALKSLPLQTESDYIAGTHDLSQASAFSTAPALSEDELDAANLDEEFEYNDIIMEDISKIESEDLDLDAAYIATLEADIESTSTNPFRTSTSRQAPGLGFGNALGLDIAPDGFVAKVLKGKEEQERIKREMEEEVPMRFHEVQLSAAEIWLYEDPVLGDFRCKSLSHLRKSWTRIFDGDWIPYDSDVQ